MTGIQARSFSRDEAIGFGWNTMKANIGFFITVLLIAGTIHIAYNMVRDMADKRTVTKEDLLSATHDTDGLFEYLAAEDYIDHNGSIQENFSGIRLSSDLKISVYKDQADDISVAMNRAYYRVAPYQLILYAVSIPLWLLTMLVAVGLIKISLKFCNNETPEVPDLFSGLPILLKYIAGHVLYVLIVIAGFILLIVPSVIWAVKFQFVGYFIIDKGCGPIEALKKSWAVTTAIKWDLFVFGAVIGFINLAGILCLFVGLFATIPTTMVAYAFVYRKLLEENKPAAIC